jgi:hypothetical protein
MTRSLQAATWRLGPALHCAMAENGANDTRWDKLVRWAKNNPAVVGFMALAAILGAVAGILTSSASIREAFSKRTPASTAQATQAVSSTSSPQTQRPGSASRTPNTAPQGTSASGGLTPRTDSARPNLDDKARAAAASSGPDSARRGDERGGNASVSGNVKAGDGKTGDGGAVLIEGGKGGPGQKGGDATVGPGTYRAGDGGAGGGKGGDLIIRAGDGGSGAPSIVFSDSERLVLKEGLEPGRGAEIMVVQVGGVDARAVGTQIRDAFTNAGWKVTEGYVGQLSATVVDASGAGAVEPRGLYLITQRTDQQASTTILSAFENARHPVSVNGSRVLRPRGDMTLYVVYQK